MKELETEKRDIQSELESIAPSLAKMHGQPEGFEVPPNYFRQLDDELARKLGATVPIQSSWMDKLTTFLQSLFQTRKAYALATIALVAIAVFWLTNNTNSIAEESFDQLSLEDIQGYIETNIDDFELDLLSDMASTEDGDFELILQAGDLDEEELDLYLNEIINDLKVDGFEDLL